MKVAILAMLLTILVVTKADKKRCNSDDECDADQCCIHTSMFLKGFCKPYAQESESCSDMHMKLGEKHILRCPCAEGLKCEAEEEKDTIFGKIKMNQRCVSGTGEPEPEEPTEE